MIEDLLEKQKELMEEVPHDLRPEVYASVMCVRDVIEKSLLYLTSLGHKPWRPHPLPPDMQQVRLDKLLHSIGVLLQTHNRGFKPSLEGKEYEDWTRKLISGFGIIEETLEYLESLEKATKGNQLEEITDVLFFYLELVILGGFSWAEIEEEYIRKWDVNMERYRRAKEGNYSWNHRDKGDL